MSPVSNCLWLQLIQGTADQGCHFSRVNGRIGEILRRKDCLMDQQAHPVLGGVALEPGQVQQLGLCGVADEIAHRDAGLEVIQE